MNILKSSCLAALVGFVALTGFSDEAAADLLLPNDKEIFDNHDNPAPGLCHPALQNEVYVKSNGHGWGPWGATSEMKAFLTPSSQGTPISYKDAEDPPWACVVAP
jgi:hypothetical protein